MLALFAGCRLESRDTLMTSGNAITTLVVFIISIIFVFRPVTIPTPCSIPRIPIILATAPIFAVALLWATQCLDPVVIHDGIVGTEGIKPYNVLIHIFSLAYMAITLDITGVPQPAAFRVGDIGGHKGWKVYFYFVMLALLSIPLGNDPAMLSGTAFLFYYTKAERFEPWARVMARSVAANSVMVFVMNPTNVVVCECFSINDNDAAFAAYTILPFIAFNVLFFAALASQHRTLARTVSRNPQDTLLVPVGTWVGSILLGGTLILCLVVSFFGVDVWMISLPFAVGKLLFDLGWDHHRHTYPNPMVGCGSPIAIGKADRCATIDVHQRVEDILAYCPSPDEDRSRHSLIATPLERRPLNKKFDEGSLAEEHQHTQRSPLHHSSLADTKQSLSLPPDEETTIESQPGTSNIESKTKPQPSAPKATIKLPRVLRGLRSHMDYWCDQLIGHFPTFLTALPQLPVPLIPFTFSQCILVEVLDQQGWVEVFADWIVRASGNQIHHTTWLISVLGVILCNLLGTNIGTVLLLTKVVRAASLPYGANCTAAIALTVASSFGAVSFTLSASLVGLLWRAILERKGTHARQWDFALWNRLLILVTTGVGLRIVSAKMAVLCRSWWDLVMHFADGFSR